MSCFEKDSQTVTHSGSLRGMAMLTGSLTVSCFEKDSRKETHLKTLTETLKEMEKPTTTLTGFQKVTGCPTKTLKAIHSEKENPTVNCSVSLKDCPTRMDSLMGIQKETRMATRTGSRKATVKLREIPKPSRKGMLTSCRTDCQKQKGLLMDCSTVNCSVSLKVSRLVTVKLINFQKATRKATG